MGIPFQYGSATCYLSVMDKHHAFVNSVHAHVKGRGHGTGLMENVIAYADSQQMVLFLTCEAYGTGRILSNDQLVEFYSKFGFVREEGRPYYPVRMRRQPREKNMSHNETYTP